MTCLNCNKNEAVKDIRLGWLPCRECQGKGNRVSEAVEFTSDSIKEQRKAFGDDIVQAHRKGDLSKEWLDIHGKKAALDRGFSPTEIKKAKNVWGSYYSK